MLREKIILVGAFHETIELCEKTNKEIVGIIDNRIQKKYLNYEIFGNDNYLKNNFKDFLRYKLIITPDNPDVRHNLYFLYKQLGFKFAKLISPDANLSKSCSIGIGTTIMKGVSISAFSKINNFVKINSNANITHDVKIGSFTTIAPNAVILGRVKIGRLVYIGANSTILPNIKIGNNAIIGAGAVITKNIRGGKIMIGNPSRELKK
jgi:sugar O-acyltransferase (sialic acid O-acetyltransferase NeuD family)